jgi:hypothetical protein
MELYACYLCDPDGHAASFETLEAVSDAEALARSRGMLEQHATCAYVVTWCGDRKVGKLYRSPASAERRGSTAV